MQLDIFILQRSDTTIRVHALDLNESGRVDLSSFQDGADPKQEVLMIAHSTRFPQETGCCVSVFPSNTMSMSIFLSFHSLLSPHFM